MWKILATDSENGVAPKITSHRRGRAARSQSLLACSGLKGAATIPLPRPSALQRHIHTQPPVGFLGVLQWAVEAGWWVGNSPALLEHTQYTQQPRAIRLLVCPPDDGKGYKAFLMCRDDSYISVCSAFMPMRVCVYVRLMYIRGVRASCVERKAANL